MVIGGPEADTHHPEPEYDVGRAGRGGSQPRARAQSKSSDQHEREIGAHIPEVGDAEECLAVRERVIGRILGERRKPERFAFRFAFLGNRKRAKPCNVDAFSAEFG